MKELILSIVISIITLTAILSYNKSITKVNEKITNLELRIDSIENNLPK